MINIKKYFILPVLGAALLLQGCDKDLDLKPTDSITGDIAFTAVADLESGLVGAYAALGNNDINLSNYLSDESYYPIENNTGRGAIQYRWEYDSSDGTLANNFVNLYATINRVNQVLIAFDRVQATSATETATKNKVKGELLALRAYAHFQLLKSYASGYNGTDLGIAYIDEKTAGVFIKPSRLSVAESFARIEADLTTAKGLIPTSFTDNTRITNKGVAAIQARVYLYEQKWDLAIAATTEVINAIPLATIAQFPNIWTDAGNNEVVWKLKRVSGDARIGDLFASTANAVEFAASPKIIAALTATTPLVDVRFANYLKITPGRGTNKTPNLISKYYGGNSATRNLADIKLFRTSEMYLIRAEAYAEKENYLLAVGDVNTLRRNRITGYVDLATYADKPSAVADVYLERFRELAWEGHRYFDLRRRGLAIDRLPLAPDDNSGGAVNLTSAKKQYFMPISTAEILANPNYTQNPVWK